jgi:membrane protease subunit HflK
MKRWLGLLSVALLAYLATGVYFVQPDEQALIRRFGAVIGAPSEPGPHFGLPWGMDKIDRLKPREVKRVTIGPLDVAADAVGATPSQFMTGDRNLVNVRATIQFTISEPRLYRFQSAETDRLVSAAAEAALTQALAEQPVDLVLTLGKRELGVRLAKALQSLVDSYRLGIAIRSVDIGGVEPPPEVADAFDKVTSALREREQSINQAHSFASRTVAQAQGDSQRILDEGKAHRDRVVQQAQGEAERFESLLAEYRRSPALTATRLYLEAMAQILPKLRSKLIIDSESEVDLSILREERP